MLVIMSFWGCIKLNNVSVECGAFGGSALPVPRRRTELVHFARLVDLQIRKRGHYDVELHTAKKRSRHPAILESHHRFAGVGGFD